MSERKLTKWSIVEAAFQFDVDRITLTNKLKAAGHTVGRGNKFSAAECYNALVPGFDEAAHERMRKVKADADLGQIKIDEKLGKLVDIDELRMALEETVLMCRDIVLGSTMSKVEKEQILTSLSGIDI
jgi:hypothetical protein